MLSCKNNETILNFKPENLTYEIIHKGFSWVSDGRKPYVIIRKKIGKKYVYAYRSFSSSHSKRAYTDGNKIVVTYGGFYAFGKKLNFTLICTAELTKDGEVVFSLRPQNETEMDIQAVYYPAPFNAKVKNKVSYAVDTMRQGFLMPDGYKENLLSTIGFANIPRKINTGDCYQPFWGRVSGKNGFCAIVETPFDASMFSCFGKNFAFLNSVNWNSSLGKLGYERRIRFIFHSDCNYNDIAKDYRKYLIENNSFVTMADKIQKNKNIKNIIGAPVLHCGIFSNIDPKSKFYNKDGDNTHLLASFYKRADQYEKIKDMGLKNLYIHTDGWGNKGYDNNHPYVLPPCSEAGGFEGMKQLADTCRRLGYTFGIHDQYRDFYYSCSKFDIGKAVTRIDGTHPYCDIWAGGAHSWLCTAYAYDFVKQTFKEFAEHGIDIQAAYLDVFSIVAGDECFNKNHRITREESIRLRGKCFDYLTEQGIIPSSEEPGSQLIDKLALVHHGPYTLRPQERGKAVGIPVPLLSLVYHDCIMIPWISKGTGGWGIPNGDSAKLHCILNAGMPYFEPFDENSELLPEKELKSEIERVAELCEIQKSLYDKEMLSHCFINGDLRRQRCEYSDGTVIEINFDLNTYEVKRGKGSC